MAEPMQAPEEQQAPEETLATADPGPIGEVRAAIRGAILSRTERCAGAQDPEEADKWADTVLNLSQALSLVDPSLHPKKDAPAGSKPQDGAGGAKKKRPTPSPS